MPVRKPSWCLWLAVAAVCPAQTTPEQVRATLAAPLQSPDVVAHQLRRFLIAKAPRLPAPSSAAEWTERARQLRRRVLDDIAFHGWPRPWIESPPRFEAAGEATAGTGYRLRRFRYEIVPGFWSTAVLYEPEKMADKVPAILNVNGHVGPPGKAVEYKQKRAITQARHGILALSLEWIGMGELSQPENRHWFGGHLDLAGSNALGLFYLAMRRGLDFLAADPRVDRARLGVTGLSGGGWQTIVLSALDERVTAAAPVAGYSAFVSRVERPADTGDIEQNATDLLTVADYPHLTALRAPRPTLLIYNAEDDCCFRAPLVKPYIFDAVRPFFRLYGAEDRFGWHENTDPSTHNYELDNRLHAYRFFASHLAVPSLKEEPPIPAAEILTPQQLAAGVPAGNLTILGLARKLATGIERRAPARERLGEVVRYRQTAVERAWPQHNTKNKGLETRAYRFDFANGLSATGVWLHAIEAPQAASATIILNDKGKQEAASLASSRVNRGEQVLAADLLFTGDASPVKPDPLGYAQMIAAVGDRPLGLEAAQLIALAEWLRNSGATGVRVETSGIRSQLTALVAVALAPRLFGEIVTRDGMTSLQYLLDKPVPYEEKPDLFCLDLYKEFDIGGLVALAAPARVTSE